MRAIRLPSVSVAYESVGRKFESCRAHHNIKGLQIQACSPLNFFITYF